MYKVTSIVTAHNDRHNAFRILEQLRSQTHTPDEIIVLASDMDVEGIVADKVVVQPNYNDWGAAKRREGVRLATGDRLHFVNADDDYDSAFIELMLTDSDITLCDFQTHHYGQRIVQSKPSLGECTSGNYMINRKIAQEVGYNHDSYEQDGLFIHDLLQAGATWERVPQLLYWHR